MVNNNRFSGYRFLTAAIIISLAMHLFWIFAVKVVFVPPREKQIKFSKVSFLGPILTRVGMEVLARPKARSVLEKRYLAAVEGEPYKKEWLLGQSNKCEPEKGLNLITDGKLAYFIDDALSGPKLEPPYGSD